MFKRKVCRMKAKQSFVMRTSRSLFYSSVFSKISFSRFSRFRFFQKQWVQKLFFVSTVFFMGVFSQQHNVHAVSLDGTSNISYQTDHIVFHDGEYAIGCVILKNGFTVSDYALTVMLDIVNKVSGPIDFRDFCMVNLNGDLELDSTVTLSNGGSINGHKDGQTYTIGLDGDLTIPAGKQLHITGTTIINGRGTTIHLEPHAQITVDNNTTLTLKNVRIKNTRNSSNDPVISLGAIGGKLALQDVELALADDFYFDKGQLFVHGDVVVSGTSSFIYQSICSSCIVDAATWGFDKGSTFFYAPLSTSNNLITMQSKTAGMYFDGATLQTTTTGIRLSKGMLCFDNNVTLSSSVKLTDALATSIFFSQITTLNYGVGIWSVNWSPDGNYLAVGGNSPTSGHDEIEIYGFNGSSLSLTYSQNTGGTVNSVDWGSDGKYLAVGGNSSTSGHDEIEIYGFNGSSLSLTYSQNYGGSVESVDWSPDGKHLAVGGNSPGGGHDEIEVYGFNGSSLSLIDTQNFGGGVFAVNWSPDGNYLAVGGAMPVSGHGEIEVYGFNGSSLSLICLQNSVVSYAFSVNWSPDGNYLAVGGHSFVSDELLVYAFNGFTLAQKFSESFDTYAYSVDWSPDGNYFAVGGVYVVASGHDEIEVYKAYRYISGGGQTFSNGIIFGDSSQTDGNLDVRVLGGAYVEIDGVVYDDSV